MGSSIAARAEFKFDVWRGLRGVEEARFYAPSQTKLLLDLEIDEGADTV